MARGRILVVEDEEDILELIRYALVKEGYDVSVAPTGEEGLTSARKEPPDLIVLDLMLPELSGFEVCAQLKADPRTRDIPVVMLTARNDESDIVAGLTLGADDYIVKPFSPRVLVARMKSVLRRLSRDPVDAKTTLTLRDLVINPGKHEVTVRGKPVHLTATEFRILHFLASRPGWVFDRSRIADAVHGGEGYIATSRTVDVQIASLRKKLGPAGTYIETVRGTGYRCKE
jgi:two-component system, OmpR family, alkaline phosphatase synthesis response regulator PhoP